MTETVDITNERGVTKKYETVASRVFRFRADHPDWFIDTKVLHINDVACCVRTEIGWTTLNNEGEPRRIIVGTGLAEEYRDASEINRTSALENAETSAIGRALAASGYASPDSYASANEVQNAIAARRLGDPKVSQDGAPDLRPGALIVLQQAAEQGFPALEHAWKKTLTKEMREACKGDIAGLKQYAKERQDNLNRDFATLNPNEDNIQPS